MQSAIYQGFVWHKRHHPRSHSFSYRVFMMYLDLAEVDQVLALSKLWSRSPFSLARFKRSDFFQPDQSVVSDDVADLDRAVREAVQSKLDFYPQGPVRLLTNLRYFGYLVNPISCYYCFSERDEALQALLIEVTNTPWRQKTQYVLDLREYSPAASIEFTKAMHVSPFMPMDMNYRWCGKIPGEKLQYSLTNYPVGNPADDTVSAKVFDAGVNFKRIELTRRSLNRIVLKYPFMTLRVAIGIYWQALKLALKGMAFLPHPDKGR